MSNSLFIEQLRHNVNFWDQYGLSRNDNARDMILKVFVETFTNYLCDDLKIVSCFAHCNNYSYLINEVVQRDHVKRKFVELILSTDQNLDKDTLRSYKLHIENNPELMTFFPQITYDEMLLLTKRCAKQLERKGLKTRVTDDKWNVRLNVDWGLSEKTLEQNVSDEKLNDLRLFKTACATDKLTNEFFELTIKTTDNNTVLILEQFPGRKGELKVDKWTKDRLEFICAENRLHLVLTLVESGVEGILYSKGCFAKSFEIAHNNIVISQRETPKFKNDSLKDIRLLRGAVITNREIASFLNMQTIDLYINEKDNKPYATLVDVSNMKTIEFTLCRASADLLIFQDFQKPVVYLTLVLKQDERCIRCHIFGMKCTIDFSDIFQVYRDTSRYDNYVEK